MTKKTQTIGQRIQASDAKLKAFEFILTILNTDGAEHKVVFEDFGDVMREASKLLRSLRVAAVTITKVVA